MMTTKQLIRRTVSVSEDPYQSDSGSSKEEEKTIPFLRRLVDMLKENDDVISFYPGTVTTSGKAVVRGRIVVHDRLKVEADILPRYFNHSSFASLRRQLNYFCFTRMGKGRQRGATYSNAGVIVMDDILRLKRRSTPVAAAAAATAKTATALVAGNNSNSNTSSSGKRERAFSPDVSSTSSEGEDRNTPPTTTRPAKKSRPTLISPRSSPVFAMEEDEEQQQQPQEEGEPHLRRISLDLTRPAVARLSQPCLLMTSSSSTTTTTTPSSSSSPHWIQDVVIKGGGEDDVLAGCHALLSFSRSMAGELVA